MRTLNEREALLRSMRALAARRAKAASVLTAIDQARVPLYEQARAFDPPLTFREIAECFGVTTTAIQQACVRHHSPRVDVESTV